MAAADRDQTPGWRHPSSGRRRRSSPAQQTIDKAHQVRHDLWPQQPRIIAAQSPLVFGEADFEQLSRREFDVADSLAPVEREIVVLGRLRSFLGGIFADAAGNSDPLPYQKAPHREN